jgi:hypothetical protein
VDAVLHRIHDGSLGPMLVVDHSLIDLSGRGSRGEQTRLRESMLEKWPNLQLEYRGIDAGGVDISGLLLPFALTHFDDPWGLVLAGVRARVSDLDSAPLLLVDQSLWDWQETVDEWVLLEALARLRHQHPTLLTVFHEVEFPELGVRLSGVEVPQPTCWDPWRVVPAVLESMMVEVPTGRSLRVTPELMFWVAERATPLDLETVWWSLTYPSSDAAAPPLEFELRHDGVEVAGVELSTTRVSVERTSTSDPWGLIPALLEHSLSVHHPVPTLALPRVAATWLQEQDEYDVRTAMGDIGQRYQGLIVKVAGVEMAVADAADLLIRGTDQHHDG